MKKYLMIVGGLKLKRVICFITGLMCAILASPATAFAAEPSAHAVEVIVPPLWLCIPFAGLLMCIAVMPLVRPAWWESHQPHVDLICILAFVIPFTYMYGGGHAAETVLECLIGDYLTFIVLLFGLFCVAGNITMEGDLAGSPRVNMILLTVGTLLSSLIGTTGASMLMVRPVIKMNAWRK